MNNSGLLSSLLHIMRTTTPRTDQLNLSIYVSSLTTFEDTQVLVVLDISLLPNTETGAGDRIIISRYLVSPLHLKTLFHALGVSGSPEQSKEHQEVLSRLTTLRLNVPGISQVIAPRSLLAEKKRAFEDDTRNFLESLNVPRWRELLCTISATCSSLTWAVASLQQAEEYRAATKSESDLSPIPPTGKSG